MATTYRNNVDPHQTLFGEHEERPTDGLGPILMPKQDLRVKTDISSATSAIWKVSKVGRWALMDEVHVYDNNNALFIIDGSNFHAIKVRPSNMMFYAMSWCNCSIFVNG